MDNKMKRKKYIVPIADTFVVDDEIILKVSQPTDNSAKEYRGGFINDSPFESPSGSSTMQDNSSPF